MKYYSTKLTIESSWMDTKVDEQDYFVDLAQYNSTNSSTKPSTTLNYQIELIELNDYYRYMSFLMLVLLEHVKRKGKNAFTFTIGFE